MFCGNCGTQIEDGSQFCGNCGTSVALDSAPQQQNRNIAPMASAQQANTQTNYVPPPQTNYAAPTYQPQAGGKNLGSTGLVLGICSAVAFFLSSYEDIFIIFVFPAIMLELAGIIVSAIALIQGKKAGQPAGMAIAGLVLNIICIAYTCQRFN